MVPSPQPSPGPADGELAGEGVLTIALDIGGTFTDLIAFDQASGTIHHTKSSSTPYDLAV
ncbi:MAG TPA: hydantoinase/oxoprolinase N-terminal domain-containing protein, partial [Chloroflexota bacterium]|nr:hydantoinase/oxoprolinase N-terminal domain-containing protein [Chloroflexota bacterium]